MASHNILADTKLDKIENEINEIVNKVDVINFFGEVFGSQKGQLRILTEKISDSEKIINGSLKEKDYIKRNKIPSDKEEFFTNIREEKGKL